MGFSRITPTGLYNKPVFDTLTPVLFILGETVKYNKLVRDRIPDIARADGNNPITHIAGGDELRARLVDKLYEEVGEFVRNWDIKELADIVEVARKLSEVIGFSPEQLEFERQKKAQEKGDFSRCIVLDEA